GSAPSRASAPATTLAAIVQRETRGRVRAAGSTTDSLVSTARESMRVAPGWQYVESRRRSGGRSGREDGEGAGGGGRARLDAELPQHVLEVLVDRAPADAQDRRDVAVGLALGNPGQDLGLAATQPERFQPLGPERAVLLGQEQQALLALEHQAHGELAAV